MKHRDAFLKICDKMGMEPDEIAGAIRVLSDSGSVYFGPFKITLHYSKQEGKRRLYMVSLHDHGRLITKAFVDIKGS